MRLSLAFDVVSELVQLLDKDLDVAFEFFNVLLLGFKFVLDFLFHGGLFVLDGFD